MSNKETKTYVVYFEIFGAKKKYTVNHDNVNSQLEAENYVRYILIPQNTKFHKLGEKTPSSKEKNTIEEIEETFDRLSKSLGDWLDKFKK